MSVVLTPIVGMSRLAGLATTLAALGCGTAAQWPLGIGTIPGLVMAAAGRPGLAVWPAQITPAAPAPMARSPATARAAAHGLRMNLRRAAWRPRPSSGAAARRCSDGPDVAARMQGGPTTAAQQQDAHPGRRGASQGDHQPRLHSGTGMGGGTAKTRLHAAN